MANNNNRNDEIKRFELPRLDWHDQVAIDEISGEIIGRIYKDALIENFNAIEDKSLELQKLDVLDISIPEPTDFVYEDSSLESSDDNQVINLRSLVKILSLDGYPLKLSFTNTKCNECRYYKLLDNDVEIKSLLNIETGASLSKPYIYLDTEHDTLESSSNSNWSSRWRILIGFYVGGNVIHMRSSHYPSSSTIKGS